MGREKSDWYINNSNSNNNQNNDDEYLYLFEMNVNDSENGEDRRDGNENNRDYLYLSTDLITPVASRIANDTVVTQTHSTPPPASTRAEYSPISNYLQTGLDSPEITPDALQLDPCSGAKRRGATSIGRLSSFEGR